MVTGKPRTEEVTKIEAATKMFSSNVRTESNAYFSPCFHSVVDHPIKEPVAFLKALSNMMFCVIQSKCFGHR